MNKTQKQENITQLASYFTEYNHFYVMNTEALNVAQINTLRRECFKEKVVFKVAKNTLIKRALNEANLTKSEAMDKALNGVTALLFSENPKSPALIIKAFREQHPGDKPQLKLASIDTADYVGDDQLSVLLTLKTKKELVADVLSLLQAPVNNVVSGLQGGSAHKLAGLLQALEEKAAARA